MGEEVAVDAFMQRRQRDDAEYRRKLATAGKPEVEWQRTAETWFDGSVESIDRRLGLCDRLLTAARGAVGAGGVTNSGLTRIASLEASQKQLQGLRRDLLTAASDRVAGHPMFDDTTEYDPYHGTESTSDPHAPDFEEQGGPDWESFHQHDHRQRYEGFGSSHGHDWAQRFSPSHNLSDRLSRRWVELEAAKFVRAHDVPMEELQIRAKNFAELKTSTLSAGRSETITRAFVQRVAQLHRQFPRQRVASTTPVRQAPDEMMFW